MKRIFDETNRNQQYQSNSIHIKPDPPIDNQINQQTLNNSVNENAKENEIIHLEYLLGLLH